MRPVHLPTCRAPCCCCATAQQAQEDAAKALAAAEVAAKKATEAAAAKASAEAEAAAAKAAAEAREAGQLDAAGRLVEVIYCGTVRLGCGVWCACRPAAACASSVAVERGSGAQLKERGRVQLPACKLAGRAPMQ